MHIYLANCTIKRHCKKYLYKKYLHMYVMSGKCKKYLNMYVYIPSNCATERQRVRQQKRPTLEAKETYTWRPFATNPIAHVLRCPRLPRVARCGGFSILPPHTLGVASCGSPTRGVCHESFGCQVASHISQRCRPAGQSSRGRMS